MLRREEFRDLGLITLMAAVPVVLLRPFQDAPFADDWTYAWSVEHFLQTGELRILDWSTSIHVTQILWGSLFCLPFGFSFSALRLSTWVLALLSLWGLYLLLRELGIPPPWRTIGTAVLAFYPNFFFLSFTYMTDVPFLSFLIWSCFCMVRGVRRRRDCWLVAGVLFIGLSVGVRLVGVAVAAAMLASLLLHSGRWGRAWFRLLMPFGPVLFAVFLMWWHASHIEYRADLRWIENSPEWRKENLKWSVPRMPRSTAISVTSSAGMIGIALAPLAIGTFRRRNLGRTALVLVGLATTLAVQVWSGDRYVAPLAVDQLWSAYGVGHMDGFVPNYDYPEMPYWWTWACGAVGLGLFSMVLAPALRRRWPPGLPVLAWVLSGQICLMALLWLFHDRYVLVLIPPAIAIVLSFGPPLRSTVAIALVVALLLVSVVGTHDHLEYSRALWAGVSHLLDIGVPASDINGGYVVNGWLQYAHPENGIRDNKGTLMVPWVNAKDVGQGYQLSNAPVPGWTTIKTIPYKRWLSGPGAVYAIQRGTR